MAAVWVAPHVPGVLLGYPVTTYSIEYDIYTLANELDTPAGWYLPRGGVFPHYDEDLFVQYFCGLHILQNHTLHEPF